MALNPPPKDIKPEKTLCRERETEQEELKSALYSYNDKGLHEQKSSQLAKDRAYCLLGQTEEVMPGVVWPVLVSTGIMSTARGRLMNWR